MEYVEAIFLGGKVRVWLVESEGGSESGNGRLGR